MKIDYFCINLDKRSDRWESFVKSATQAGFDEDEIQRFSAIENTFGALGCAQSHLIILTSFLIHSESDFLCIFEDDFIFTSKKFDIIKNIKELSDRTNWDALLLSGTFVTNYNNDITINTKKLIEAQSACAYIVNKNYVHILAQKFIESVSHLKEFQNMKDLHNWIVSRAAIDVYWKSLMRSHNWYICLPIMGHQSSGYSDIEKKFVDYTEYFPSKK